MNTGSVMALGVMIGAMIAAWFLSRKSAKKNCEYDEMQLKIRSKGYQIGFFTALILMMIVAFLCEMDCLTVLTPGFAVFAALLVSVTVFAIYCVLHDAFISIRGDGKSQIGVYGLIVLVEGLVTVRTLSKGEMLVSGKLGFSSGAPAMMFVCFLTILIALIIKVIRNRKEAEE